MIFFFVKTIQQVVNHNLFAGMNAIIVMDDSRNFVHLKFTYATTPAICHLSVRVVINDTVDDIH